MQVSTFSLGGEVCKEELVALGQGLETRRIVALNFSSPKPQAQMSSLWPKLRV